MKNCPPTVLQFSGGRDSLACLYLCQPRWHEITVAWVNTGAAFPETIEQMKAIAQMVPHFLEIRSQQTIETQGYPADVVPVASTALGQLFEGARPRTFQSRYACCTAALWGPTATAMKELGATTIIRGQKKADFKQSPIESGSVIGGVTYLFPLADWTDADVETYLARLGIALPENYRLMSTGLDCWNCTAYLDENAGKLEYMKLHHPAKHAIIQDVLIDLQQTLHQDLKPLRQIKASYS